MADEIKFAEIAARGGSQTTAFEELCAQLAKKDCPQAAAFERFRGTGGDGGVECIATLANGHVIGWQAKYVFSVTGLIAQAEKSFQTAISVHKKLTKYFVCFPFDPSGRTGRKTRAGRPANNDTQKLKEWAKKKVKEQRKAGRRIKIQFWNESTLRSLLLSHDVSGGIRHYFFSKTILSRDWFADHLLAAAKAAGPRYTPELSIETPLGQWLSSFEQSDEWRAHFDLLLKQCLDATDSLTTRVNSKGSYGVPAWPVTSTRLGKEALKICRKVIGSVDVRKNPLTDVVFTELLNETNSALSTLQKLKLQLKDELESKHGQGMADSQRFRQFRAEMQGDFPAANLDSVEVVRAQFETVQKWLNTPSGFLAFKRAFILSGIGGSGKTHGICDFANSRLKTGALTCILFGHHFDGHPAVWTQISESLGLPLTLGKDALLDCLNAAGESSGIPLILFIDAINETRPRDYWLNRYAAFAHEFEKRPYLKLCVSCRTSFLAACLQPSDSGKAVEHHGFAGLERKACNAFFTHYNLEPPIVPLLQPELSNPLYLKILCETLRLGGLKQIPTGWFGLAPVIRAFLHEKEKQFAADHGTAVGAAIIAKSLTSIASALADSGIAYLTWSQAQQAIDAALPHMGTPQLIDWLVKADLLIEEGSGGGASIISETILRLAFERFGDFLVASELLPKNPAKDFSKRFKNNRKIKRLLLNTTTINANAGVLSALSVLVPEIAGIELPQLIPSTTARKTVLTLTIRCLPWRTPDTFSPETRKLARQGLTQHPSETLDSLLACASQRSQIDAYWVFDILNSIEISKRDSFWCEYLRQRLTTGGIVERLINASDEVDLQKIDSDTALRWVTLLSMFTAAADRRIKDQATRAIVKILRQWPKLIPSLVDRVLRMDDDEVRERILLCSYGALICSRDRSSAKRLAETLLINYRQAPTDFQNAIIRDHIRCIGELAQILSCLGAQFKPVLPSESRKSKSDWPLKFPKDAKVARWEKGHGAVYQVAYSCLHDDFNHYTINCLHPWRRELSSEQIGKWILNDVVSNTDLAAGYCDAYDSETAATGGGSRGKPSWAERIGKKYQWVSLYRLASRLHDHVKRKMGPFEPKLLRKPLILQEERKIDPTFSRTSVRDKTTDEWWLHAKVDFAKTRGLSDVEWLKKEDDLPNLKKVLQPSPHNGQCWIPITAFPSWNDRVHVKNADDAYRYTWFNLRAYLVKNDHLDITIDALKGRNYFGDWLPVGAKWLHVFAGEYPWATACNTEPDWYLGGSEVAQDSNLQLIHGSNQVAEEWGYDATLPESIYLQVPARAFFSPNDLWWNGENGFSTPNGRTVFQDPRVNGGCQSALLADIDDLLPRLRKIGYRVLWTMVGEKSILGKTSTGDVWRTYSQLAVLNNDGSIRVLNRYFFRELEQQGLKRS